jgi:ParB family chromosome partitioning protein
MLKDQLPEEEEEESEEQEAAYARLEEVRETLWTLQRHRKRLYSDTIKAHCGVVISVSQDGKPELVYGLLRKEDERSFTQQQQQATKEDTPALSSIAQAAEPAASPYSALLLESLTTHKTAALAAELAQQPRLALAAVVHALVLSQFGLDLSLYRSTSSLQLSSRQPSLAAAEGSPACLFLEEQRQAWLAQLPTESDILWRWCLAQDQDTLLRLLAYCAARSVNGIQAKSDYDFRQRLDHAHALGLALQIDIAKWFTPTADNFFSKVPKARIVASLAEAGKPLIVESGSLKKADLAARAEKAIQNTGWLPEPVRMNPAVKENATEPETGAVSGKAA